MKARTVNAPISLEDLIVKELPLPLEGDGISELSVRMDPTNKDSTHVERKIRFLDHSKTF